MSKKKENDKKFYEKHKHKIIERQKNYYYSNKGQIAFLKRSGFKHTEEEFLQIINKFNNSIYCELCNCEMTTGFRKGNRKVKDHDHRSGCFRNICCNICNLYRTKIDNKMNFVLLELHRYFIYNNIIY